MTKGEAGNVVVRTVRMNANDGNSAWLRGGAQRGVSRVETLRTQRGGADSCGCGLRTEAYWRRDRGERGGQRDDRRWTG